MPADEGTGKHKRRRPVKYEMPPPIPDTAENVLKAIFAGPPSKQWDYLKGTDRDKPQKPTVHG
jgi:hypothetical protein